MFSRFWDWMYAQWLNETGLDVLVIAVVVVTFCVAPALVFAWLG